MKKFTYLSSIIILLVLLTVPVFGQINTPAGANWPFGSRIQQFAAPYPFGIVPGNLPGGAYTPASNLYGKSQDAYTAYVAWRANYVVNCGGTPTSMRIKFDDPTETVSEGIGYGMLLAAYAADKALFDGLWTYYRNNITYGQYGDVMGWRRNGCANGGTGAGSENGATDSELDVAMALIIAECQWPTAISPYDYGAQATTLIRQIRLWEITNASCGTANQISNGDGFVVGNSTCRNPSYQAPAYVKLFQAFDPTAPANYWNTTVYNTIYPLLNANNNNTTGLVSNWCDNVGTPNTCNSPAFNDYGYDACRHPWRIATDYIWHGDASALAQCALITDNFIGTRATLGSPATYTANIKGPRDLNGNTNGRTTPAENSIFTSTWAVGCMGVTTTANRQTRLNDMYLRAVAVQETYSAAQPTNYYGNTIRTLMLFQLSGNFWKPCPPRCQNPVMANDTISLCSGTPNITLDAGLPAASFRFFNWYRNTTATNVGTTPIITNVNTTGKYFVVVDSINGAYNCSRADTVVVINTMPTPKLGPNRSVCSPTPAILDANVSGSPAYTYQWAYSSTGLWSGLSDITYLGTSKTYSAKSPGLYRVTVSAGACATRFDTITVRSLLPTPVDGCIAPGPGTVNLSITDAPGIATDYEWYAAPTGGASLGTGTTFLTGSLSSTTTYYVLDKTKQAGYVGLKVPTTPNYSTTLCSGFTALANEPASGVAGVDNPQSYQQTFTTYVNNVYIDSITVYFCLYGPGAVNATFNLQTAVGGATAFTSGLQTVTPTVPGTWFNAPYNTGGRVTGVRFKVGINIATAGTYRMALAAPAATTGNVFIHQDNAVAYSYVDDIDGNTLRIENTFGYTTTYTMRHGPMYNWRILAPKTCDRLPVTAYVVPSGCGAILPVQLLSFQAKYLKTNVQLNWVSASETDNQYYYIERSSDNGTFKQIGKVKAAGNSFGAKSYTFTDYQPIEGISYYRLVSVDFNGKKHYTATETINISLSDYVKVYPNPSSNSITIKALDMGNQFTSITISDLSGKLIFSILENSSEKIVDISTIPQGVYIIRVNFNDSSENVRFIKN